MRAKFCKPKNKYVIDDCNCQCSEYQKQGIGSLVGQSIDNSNNVSTTVSATYESNDTLQ